MLVLFDIDGTLLLSERAGVKAMEAAGRELFGDHFGFQDIEVAGRLDALIWGDLAERHGIENTDETHATFRSTYGRHLAEHFDRDPTARPLPGVEALLDRLEATPGVHLGLLTGNYPETGRLKIARAGIDPDRFTVAAWGIDGPSRRHLPPVALERHAAETGSAMPPERTVIIGDTPHDVDCALHHGCRVIAVATGRYDMKELAAHGASLVVETLEDTDSITRWLLEQ